MLRPHHGEINVLDEKSCLKLLSEKGFGHLGCHYEDDIYVVPISYAYEDGYIYSHSVPGKKIELMRFNPQVCLQVEEVQSFFDWKSVIAWGQFEELRNEDAVKAMRLLMKTILERFPKEEVSSLELDLSAEFEIAVIYRVKVETITGRCEGC